ncbi:MAG: TolC family protein, partial [Planctomycetota bacterium]|jgi:HAE1 family hydrophobic/amphiphilic exporter-1
VLAYNGGLRWKSPIGLSVEARYDMFRRTSESTFALDPSYTPAMSVQVRQALTRGFGLDVNKAFITVARIGHEASLTSFHDAVLRLAERVEDSYWGVAFAEENLKVARQALLTSEELLRNTQARREADVVADLDVFSAETAVASRNEQVLRAANDLANARDGLLRLILPARDLEAWNVQIVLVDKPRAVVTDDQVDVVRSIETAFERRPDLRSAALAMEIEDVQIDRARNDALPQIDLIGGWTQNGLGETHNDSHGKLFGGRFYDLSVGLEVEVPIFNVGPKARLEEAEARRRRALRQRQSLEQTVVFEVRAAARDMQSARERIRASSIAVELAEKQLQAEQDRLSEGLSTSFDVLQKEEDLTSARVVLISARLDYVRARLRLRRAEGTLLTAFDIEIE